MKDTSEQIASHPERVLKALSSFKWAIAAVLMVLILREPITLLIERVAKEAQTGSLSAGPEGVTLDWVRASPDLRDEVQAAFSQLDEADLNSLIDICRFNWRFPEVAPSPVYMEAPAWEAHRNLIAAGLVLTFPIRPEDIEDDHLRWLAFPFGGDWMWDGDPSWVRFEPADLGMEVCRAWARHVGGLLRTTPRTVPY